MGTTAPSASSRAGWLGCAVLAVWLAWPLLQPASAGAEVVARRLRAGAFLVATRNLASTPFAETVILITRYGRAGATGLTVNRPTEIPLHEAFPEVEQLRGHGGTLLLGGPVSPRAVFVLVRSDEPRAGMQRVAKGIYYSSGIEAIVGSPPKDFSDASARVFAGYAGWAPGQLEGEIARGDWIVAWEEPTAAFGEDLRELWRTLLESWSGRWT
jgi:putative transcriptional regulator